MSSEERLRLPKALVGLATIGTLIATTAVSPVAFAGEVEGPDGDSISITKSVQGVEDGTVPSYAPGAEFSYEINLMCSSINFGVCADATLTDQLPAPLQLVSASIATEGGFAKNISRKEDNFVGFQFTGKNDEGTVGMLPGTAVVSVAAKIPSDITFEEAQTLGEILNVAQFKSGALQTDDSAAITIQVEETLKAAATKSADNHMGASDRPIPAVPQKPVDFKIGAGNASNRGVDSVTLTEPAAGSENLQYLDYASVGPITPPLGADQVEISYTDANGAHVLGKYAAPLESVDLTGIDLSAVSGFSYVFSNSAGNKLPPASSEADHASVGLGMITNTNVNELAENATLTIHNVVEGKVTVDDRFATTTAFADVSIKNTPPGVTIDKTFAKTELVAGEATVVTLRATNGGKDVRSMTIAEPGTIAGAEGTTTAPNLREQGLKFTGFKNERVKPIIEWPDGATEAAITYYYDGGSEETLTTDAADTLPVASNIDEVVGFKVTFTGDIPADAYALLPFGVQALPLAAEVDQPVVSSNHVDASVVDSDGKSVEHRDDANMTRKPLRVYTEADKQIVRDEIYDHAGSSTLVTLPSKVRADSTIGSEYLVVQDPILPGSPTGASFWNNFDLSEVGPVAVDNDVKMLAEYFDYEAGKWVAFPGMPVTGPEAAWTHKLTADEKDRAAGIRFTFTPLEEGELLAPGFNVLPYLRTELRDQTRTGQDITDGATKAEITNDVRSTVYNANTGQPAHTDDAQDTVAVLPIPDGVGPDLIDKDWTPDSVAALTQGTSKVTLKWGTHGIPLDSIVITDHNPVTPVAESAFDAFDLISIPAITPQTDPGIWNDKVTVERYSISANGGKGGWVPVGNPSVGSYPGYTFSAKEQADTIGIRFHFESKVSGQPVTSTTIDGADIIGRARTIDLNLRLRDYLRSSPETPALGTQYGPTYNTGNKGLVENIGCAEGEAPAGVLLTNCDSDTLTVTDEPQNVTLSKNFRDGPQPGAAEVTEIGVPQKGTALADYPVVTAWLTAKNTSVTRVGSMLIADPDPAPLEADAGKTIYEHFNAYAIKEITIPTGANPDLTRVRVSPDINGKNEFTVAEAQNLSPAQLEDVTSISVFHSGTLAENGAYASMIASGASTTIKIEYQLRQTLRGSTAPVTVTPQGAPLENHAAVTQTRPGVENVTGRAKDDVTLVHPSYGVTPKKTLSPSTRVEDEPRTGYKVSLSGQPTGTVRTKELSLTDTTPTFWNAFEFAGFNELKLPRPINAYKLEVLTGVEYTLGVPASEDGVPPLLQTCTGKDDLKNCWKSSTWVAGNTARTVSQDELNDLLASLDILPSQVRGIRFSFASLDSQNHQQNWERPSNPKVTAEFTANRRETLLYGIDGATNTPVPSTRPEFAPAPGESAQGTFTNTVNVFAQGSWGSPPDSLWTAKDANSAETKLTHFHNAISVDKTNSRETATANTDTFSPGALIPFTIKVENRGQWNMTGLRLTDQVAADEHGSLLVEPEQKSDEPAPFYSANVGNKPVPEFKAALDSETGEITFTLPEDFVFAVGETLTIEMDLVFRAGTNPTSPGTWVKNSVTAQSDRRFDTCYSTENGRNSATNETNNVDECTSFTEVTALASAPMSAYKSVKGVGAGIPGVSQGDRNLNDLGILGLNVPGREEELCGQPNAKRISAADGYYATPCIPVLRPGGDASWRVQVRNEGNIPVDKVATIDVLPTPGDTAVISAAARASSWAPIFTGTLMPIELQGGTPSVFYSTVTPDPSCNESELESIVGGAPMSDDCQQQRGEIWKEYSEGLSPEEKASIKALKFVVEYTDGNLLQPNEWVGFSFTTKTPAYSEGTTAPSGNAPIAWNSLASTSRGIYTPAGASEPQIKASDAVEPRKVGVALAPGRLALKKEISNQTDLDTSELKNREYNFQLACKSLGEDVPLIGSDGKPLGPISVKGDGSVVKINSGTSDQEKETLTAFTNIPLFAECSWTEVDNPSSEVSFDANPVTALDYLEHANVVNGPDAAKVEAATVTATNTFLPGGFSVTKSVDNGGAANENGDAIKLAYEYEFRASCLFLEDEVLPKEDQTFTLTEGQTKTFSNLPTGARCSVGETDTRGAKSTSVLINGSSVPTKGNQVSFDIEPDSPTKKHGTAAEFINRFAAGAVEVTKNVAGAGAEDFGKGPFVFDMTCTLEGAVNNPVYEGKSPALGPNGVWRVANLPAGSICEVSESKTGGANSTSMPLTMHVGSDPNSPTLGRFTNTFTTGSVKVTKHLDGEPAINLPGAANFEYEMTLACTREVNGETVDVAIPGGATRTIRGAGEAIYEGLPTGATCQVAETDSGHATASTVTPKQVTIGTETTATVNVTNEFGNGKVAVHKTVEAPAGFPVPSTFAATLACEWNGSAVDLGERANLTLTEGETVEVDGIPIGSECTVAEADAGQLSPENNSYPVEVTDGATPARVEIHNVYEWANLRVAKAVDAASANIPTGFEMNAKCSFLGETVLDETFTLDANETKEFSELPARSACTVTETDNRGADSTITQVDLPTGGSATLDQPNRQAVIAELLPSTTTEPEWNSVEFTNLFDVAGFVVTKHLDGGAAYLGNEREFPVTVNCTYQDENLVNQQFLLSAENGWTAAITDVVAGAECSVVEDDLSGADTAVITPNNGSTSEGLVTIPHDGTLAQVDVTNWYLTGSLEVTKAFAGEGAEQYGNGLFDLALTCSLDGQEVTIPEGNSRTVSADDPTASWTRLPTGADCILTETNNGGANASAILDANGNALTQDAAAGYSFTVATDPTILTAEDQPQPALTVENTFNLAQVFATKLVESEALGADLEPIDFGPFEVELACTWQGQDVVAAEPMTRPIANGETVSWTGLPQGADCAVSETDNGGASSTTVAVVDVDSEESASPRPGTTAKVTALPNQADGAIPNVVFTNTFETVGLEISKEVVGAENTDATGPYPVSAVCLAAPEVGLGDNTIVRKVKGHIGGTDNLKFNIERLPAGSICTITETDAGGADKTSIAAQGATVSGATATLAVATGIEQVVITNTFEPNPPVPGVPGMPNTGATSPWWFLLAALVLATFGGVILAKSRNARTRKDAAQANEAQME